MRTTSHVSGSGSDADYGFFERISVLLSLVGKVLLNRARVISYRTQEELQDQYEEQQDLFHAKQAIEEHAQNPEAAVNYMEFRKQWLENTK